MNAIVLSATSSKPVLGGTIKNVISPLVSHISYGRVTMPIFYYINQSTLQFCSYYVAEASSQSFVVKSYDGNKCVC